MPVLQFPKSRNVRVFVNIASNVRPVHPKIRGRTTSPGKLEMQDLPNLIIGSLNVYDDAQQCIREAIGG